jgi:hypothetical protein
MTVPGLTLLLLLLLLLLLVPGAALLDVLEVHWRAA